MGMLGSAKPLASLSSTLLARKGHAKPAMRPQGFAPALTPAALEDLGWNDIGPQVHAPDPQPIQPPPPEPVPPVLEERQELARQVETPRSEPEAETVTVSPRRAARIARESAAHTAEGKAAFTLRLDAERHLRLRLASAVANRSAQALVASALDQFLQTMPEVEALAAQLPSKKARP